MTTLIGAVDNGNNSWTLEFSTPVTVTTPGNMEPALLGRSSSDTSGLWQAAPSITQLDDTHVIAWGGPDINDPDKWALVGPPQNLYSAVGWEGIATVVPE